MKKIIILLQILISVCVYGQKDPFYNNSYEEVPFSSPSELPDFKPFTQSLDYNSIKIELISSNELKTLIDYRNKIFIIDCRSDNEFKTSHIKGSKLISFDNFNPQKVWMYDRYTTMVICSSNPRHSAGVAAYLKIMGFIDVRILSGSLIDWINNGYPLVDEYGHRTNILAVNHKNDIKSIKNGNAIVIK